MEIDHEVSVLLLVAAELEVAEKRVCAISELLYGREQELAHLLTTAEKKEHIGEYIFTPLDMAIKIERTS